MFVSNVGDSRAIVGSIQPDKRIVAKAMSSDQTPYRKDERERVKKHGARILSMDQIEGLEPIHENWGEVNLGEDIDEGGDPPRVWSPHGDYPGTAFTRSFGDMYAEELGVSAEAEILVRDVVSNDKYIIIASDGVFEFLTNQMVMDMAAQTTDPLEACNAIVSAAYNMWLQYEVRTDDITIIILYVENYGSEVVADTKEVAIELERGSFAAKLQSDRDERPVRRAVSREKRKNIIMAQDEEKLETDTMEMNEISLKIPKSDEERQAIEEAIRSNFLFQHINHAQRQLVVDVMQPIVVSKGDWVIRQGDKGDRFYVIDSGVFEVRVNPPGKDDTSGGPVVHVYTSGPGQHPGFGELSLM
jgi:serine/threonine protein phosphatase PrpC